MTQGGLTVVGQVYLPAIAITSITVSGTTATCTTSAAHGRATNDHVRITGCTPAALNTASVSVTVTSATVFTYTVASGTGNATVKGTVEPLGTALSPTVKADHSGWTFPWTPPGTAGQSRRIEVTVTDSGGLTDFAAHTVTTTTTANTPPVVAIVSPSPDDRRVNAAAGQTVAAVGIDPGDTISSVVFQVTNTATGAVVIAQAALTAATPALDTTLAAGFSVSDVSTLNGDATDVLTLTSATGASSTGGVVAAKHNASILVFSYTGVSGSNLTGVATLVGTGSLAATDVVRSANYSATFDASSLVAGTAYTLTVTATDSQGSTGTSTQALVINTPPVVTWILPTAGQTVKGTINVTVRIVDDTGGVAHAGLYRHDVDPPSLIDALTDNGDGTFSLSVDTTTTFTDQADHTLRVRAVDDLGLVTLSDNTFHVNQGGGDTDGPTISGILPTAGSTVNGTVTVSAQITDTSGVAAASYSVDGGTQVALDGTDDPAWAAALDTTQLTNGTHSIVIAAADSLGNVTVAPAVTFTVANTAPPPTSPDWFLPTNPLTQVHDIIAALDAAGRTDARVWATAVGIPIRPTGSGTKANVTDSHGNILGVGYAPGDSIPAGSIATSHRAITPADAAIRLAAHYGRWISTEFYDLLSLSYRTGPWITHELVDEVTGWNAAWAAGTDTNFMGLVYHGGGAGRWAGASK